MIYIVHLKRDNQSYVLKVNANNHRVADDYARRLLAQKCGSPENISVVDRFGPFYEEDEQQMPFYLYGIDQEILTGFVEQFCDELRVYLSGYSNAHDPYGGHVVSISIEGDSEPHLYVFTDINTPVALDIPLSKAKI